MGFYFLLKTKKPRGRTKIKVKLKDQEDLVFKPFYSMNKCA